MPENSPTPEITDARAAELMDMQNAGAVADTAVLAFADVYTALGRIQAASFFARIGNIAAAQFAAQVREGKKYKGMPYNDTEGNRKYISTFDEFCEVFLGKTGRYVRELVSNLHTLGTDLYEAAEKTGFRATDYAALKALPAAEQEIVKTALAAESKDQVLDILQDMAARHQSERAAMKKQTEDLQADLDARDKLLADKGDKLDKTQMELEKLKSLPPAKAEVLRLEREQEAAKGLSLAVVEAQAAINALLGKLAAIKAAEVSIYTKQHADQVASWFCQQIQFALQENGIQADMAEIVLPEWMRDVAKTSPVDQEGK